MIDSNRRPEDLTPEELTPEAAARSHSAAVAAGCGACCAERMHVSLYDVCNDGLDRRDSVAGFSGHWYMGERCVAWCVDRYTAWLEIGSFPSAYSANVIFQQTKGPFQLNRTAKP